MRRALIVGIDDYTFGPLVGCVADAEAMSDLLSLHHDKSPNFDIRLRIAPSEKITRPSLRADLTSLLEQPAEVALFYFSGHGSENDLGGYLVTQDAQTYDEGVPMVDVIALANKSTVTEVVIIVDSCHSGHLGNQIGGPRDQNAKVEIREGVSILTASRSSEPAIASGGRSVFTSLVCSALEGGAADVLGRTNVAGVFSYVDQSLGAWQQRPLFKTHISSLLTLRRTRPALELSALRRIIEIFPSPLHHYQLDPSFERTDPSANQLNVEIYDTLVKYRNAHLAQVASHDHLYFAAIESGTISLTGLGQHYWQLAREGRL